MSELFNDKNISLDGFHVILVSVKNDSLPIDSFDVPVYHVQVKNTKTHWSYMVKKLIDGKWFFLYF